MTGNELKQSMSELHLNAAQFAKVLCLHSNKLSEYLDDIQRIPCAVAYSVEALLLVPDEQRIELIQRRLQRKSHGG